MALVTARRSTYIDSSCTYATLREVNYNINYHSTINQKLIANKKLPSKVSGHSHSFLLLQPMGIHAKGGSHAIRDFITIRALLWMLDNNFNLCYHCFIN